MCGIVGVYCFDRARPVDEALLGAMTDTLAHRGPNARGLFVEPGVGLGHRRLSVIDLGGGAQPMLDERLAVVFNGEIYNYRELRAELGGDYRTDSDTEVILHAYRKWGERCVDHFIGMFAFAIYDRLEHELFLARDRLGKKPLYYYLDADRLLFASELKAILADPSVPREIEPQAVADYFALSYVPAPKTILKRIFKLPAAHTLSLSSKGVGRPSEYWDVHFEDPDHGKTIDQHADGLLELLTDATRLRLRSDVPLGAFLSGGIDSSATVAVMAGLLDRPVVTSTIGFDQAQYDERSYARNIAERFGAEHHERVVHPQALSIVDQLSWFYDEPFGDSSAVPTYYLSEMTKELVTVALSGDGGDELFAGYTRYPHGLLGEQLRSRIPELARSLLAPPIARLYRLARLHPRARDVVARGFRATTEADRSFYNHLPTNPWSWDEMVSADFREALDGYDPFESLAPTFARAPKADLLSRMQYVDLKTYLVDDILVKVDRASMAHGLEVRVPMLDHRVVEYAARVPSKLRLDAVRTKLVLRRAIRDRIPESFFDRPKQGFGIPLFEWFRSELKRPVEELFFGKTGGISGVLAGAGLKRRWHEHQLGLVHHGTAFWNGMMFERWYQRFIERA